MILTGITIAFANMAGYDNDLLPFELESAAAAPLSRITVDAGQDLGPVKLMLGFLHGLDHKSFEKKNYSPVLVAKLKPKFWRIGVDSALSNYKVAKALDPNIKITMVISDIYADILKGGYKKVRPWEDWGRYEKEIKFIVNKASESEMKIDYWDVWSEPDHKAYWPGTCEQLLELFKRTYRVIREADPKAKIVGPSISNPKSRGPCPKPFLNHFLEYLADQNLRFDAISWHEFDFPEEIPEHVESIRNVMKAHPSLGTPEIHINELSGPADHLIPAWAVGWLYYLEKANVDWASRGCWEIKERSSRWSDCQAGLNGLFLKDNNTPQAVYWVFRAYAEMTGNRLKSTGSVPRLVALASRDEPTKEIRVLIGRYDVKERRGPFADVEVEIQNYPYAAKGVQVEIQRIPSENIPGPLPEGPKMVSTGIFPINNGTAVIPLNQFQDGDAYIMILRPKG
jgi:hypothetical protein